MKIYTTDKIRNVVLLGHSGSGKTSMVEAIAKVAGITDKMGTIDAGNTISDFGKEEQKRKISCQTSIIPLEWDSRKINVIIDDDLGSYMEIKIIHYTTSSIDTKVDEGNKETVITFDQNIDLEIEDFEKLYNLTVSTLKDKKIYNYNLLKYGDIEVKVSSEYKKNIKVVNRVDND